MSEAVDTIEEATAWIESIAAQLVAASIPSPRR